MEEKLFDAIITEDNDEIKQLLSSKTFNINITNKYGNTPLFEACQKGNLEAVNLILNFSDNVEINKRCIEDYTPLHSAAQGGHTEIVTMLINKGADVNVKESNGNTPLWLGVMHNRKNSNIKIIKILLANGANPYVKNKHGVSLYNLLSMPKNNDVKDLFPPEK
jgi:uncharacterized protein